MPKVNVINMSGKSVGDLEMKADVFQVEPNIPLMHQAVVSEESNSRQGTADTKNRSEVSGGGAKPFRQKGTGRARQGSIRSPHMYHGGIVFGPTPRSYQKLMPKKMRRAALKSAFSARIADEDVIIVDEIKLDKISTKEMAGILRSVGAAGKILVILDSLTDEIRKSSRNISQLEIRIAPAVSVRDVLNADKIVMTKPAVSKFEEVFA